MRQRLVHLFQVPTDLDYVQAFQDLSKMNLEIRREGPSVDRLLRKSYLERNVGNHGAALGAVQQARELDPDNAEVHYALGVAYTYLALARAGALPVGPKAPSLPEEGIAELLSLAVEEFSRVLELNPDDADAAQDLTALADILAVGASEAELALALRSR